MEISAGCGTDLQNGAAKRFEPQSAALACCDVTETIHNLASAPPGKKSAENHSNTPTAVSF